MLLRDGIDAVMCLRGGSGSIRLLRRLDWNRIAAHPRLFIGYSDVTAIELALLACCRIPSIFGPMVASEFSRGVDRESVKLLERLAMVPHAAGLLGDARCAGASTLRGGVAEGPLVGGTLSLLVSVLGTPYLPCLAGAILFIEDVHESPARIERYLAHLQMTGILDGVSGVLVGSLSFEATDEERGHYLPFPQVLEDMLAPLNVPVVFDWPTGHLRSPLPLPQGVRVRLDADARTLEVLEPLVC
jgi:muramoyltetrapeptide carboxypeptidase